MSILWHNDDWKDDDTPIFPFSDRIRLGDGVFDTLLIVDGNPVDSENHFKRLQKSAAVFELAIPFGFKTFSGILEKLIQKNTWQSGQIAVNTIVSRGPGARGLRRPDDEEVQIIIRGAPAPKPGGRTLDLITSRTVKRNKDSPLSSIKSCNYGENILAMIEAENAGAGDAILLNTDGHVACATTSNVFVVLDGALITPPLSAGILDGTLRRKIIAKYEAKEINLTQADLKNAQDIVLSNSILGMRKAASLNGETLPGSDLEIDNTLHLK